MAATFERFLAHDWTRDTSFLVGLSSMQASWKALSPGETEQRLEGAKLFYFNRFVAPIDAAAFRAWAAERRRLDLFARFLAFDFDHDAAFQQALPPLLATWRAAGLAGDAIDRELGKLKAAHFSRYARAMQAEETGC